VHAQESTSTLAPPDQSESEKTPGIQEALSPETVGTQPWAVGVSEHEKQSARTLFSEGNALLRESFFKQAVDKYREALTHWDHPGIHYNLALALINFDVPLDVRLHLIKAMRYGAAPLDEKKLEHGKNYLTLIENQLSQITLSSQQPDTTVMLDGKRVLNVPGNYETLLPAGEHHVLATRPGYAIRNYSIVLAPGKHKDVTIRLYKEDELVQRERRWPAWLPYAITSAGVALLATGTYFTYRQNHEVEDYNNATASPACSVPGGCSTKGSLSDSRDSANTYKTLSVTSLATGAAAITAGTIMIFMNTERTRRFTPQERDPVARVQPILTPSTMGIVGSARF
jgi:hypothetical protein